MKNMLKNKNKNLKLTTLGFTLIELLAVIVILAIIALIATPIILGIVEDARKDSFMRSVELVVGTTDIDIFSKDFTDSYTYTITDGVVSNLEVGVKNTEGMNGKIKYDKNGNDTYAIHNGKYCVIKTSGMKKAEITDYVEGECELSRPTDVNYFIYDEIEFYEYEIIDKDACISVYEGMGAPSDFAAFLCNNEPLDGMTLTEYLASGDEDARYEISALKQAGAIEETLIDAIEIIGYSEDGPKDVVIPKEIDGKEVVSIGVYAFSNMALTSIELPETLEIIKHSAFSTNLFTNIALPNSLRILGDYAFCYTNLNQTSINNIEKINEYAYCTVTDENCFTYEDKELYEYEINKDACVEFFVSDGATNEEAISMCNNEPQEWLNGMTLTERLATEASQNDIDALKEAGAINEKTLESGVEITGYKCPANDIVIPNKINNKEVISIGENAFSSYEYDRDYSYLNKGTATPVNYEFAIDVPDGTLTSIAIPDGVKSIGKYAFDHNKISNLKLSSSLIMIGQNAFSNNKIYELEMPNKVSIIGNSAFSGSIISRLKLSTNLIVIGDGAFYNNVPGVLEIPDSVTHIGTGAFADSNIYDIVISDNNQLQTINDDAFSCVELSETSKAYRIISNINPAAIEICVST